MAIQSPRDLFVYDLSLLHSSEQQILHLLPQLERSCSNPQLKQMLGDHVTDTQRQVTRLEECFRSLGQQPMNVTCYVSEAFGRDFQQFMQQKPSQEAIDLYCLGAVSQTEHFEIASYLGMIQKAQAMGESQCLSSLQDTLQEEEAQAQKAEQFAKQFSTQVIGRMTP